MTALRSPDLCLAPTAPPAMPSGVLELRPPPTLQSGEGAASTALMMAVPLVGSLGSVAFVAMSGRSTQSYLAAGMFLLASLGFVAVNIWRSRTGASAQLGGRRRAYLGYLGGVRETVRAAADEQRRHLMWVHPEPRALAAMAEEGSRVWERSATCANWLHVRYATGRDRLGLELRIPESDTTHGVDPVSASGLGRLVEAHQVVDDLPATLDLGSFARAEVTGPEEPARSLARALIVQAAMFHPPDQLVIAVLTNADRIGCWDWVKWLPHAQSRRGADDAGPRRLVCTDLDELVSLLPADLGERLPFASGRRGATPHVLLVLDTFGVPGGHSVLTEGGIQGMTVLDLPERWSEPSDDSRVRLHLDNAGSTTGVGSASGPMRVTVTRSRQPSLHGIADQLGIASAEAAARRMTPLYARGRAEQRSLASNADLTDLLGIGDLAQLDLENTWRPGVPGNLLKVPIGLGADGRPVHLDLKESALGGMGPHGLVVGATGSGKSELLRTIVLGLALTHSPEALNLVLVDFKGGATFAGMTELPHVSAVITNLADELTLVDRMHDALSGEMTRRQELLRAAGNYASVRDYEKARLGGATPLVPLPTLLVVCDEFSELLSARPEFVDLFVTMGRLGRSLGIHLLLASQRLEEGRLRGLDSHLSYRIGLRTFSAAESRAVIGVPDAYELPAVPGVGYLKPDQSSLWRFTATYVSGPPTVRRPTTYTAVVPRPEALAFVPGPTTSRFAGESPRDGDSAGAAGQPPETRSVFDLAVAAMTCHGPAAHQVWLPPLDLPQTLDQLMPDLGVDPELGLVSREWRAAGPLRFPVGTIDMPREQKRQTLSLDLSGAGGHVAIVGAPRSGRSTLARTVVTALALTHTPREVQFYLLDFGGGALSGLADLPHVCGVGTRSQPEAVARIVAEVTEIVDARERLLHDHDLATFETYRGSRADGPADERPEPLDGWGDVVLVVDGWTTVRSDFEDLEPQLQVLAQRSLTIGVHLVTTASRWMDYRTPIRDVLATRIELRLGEAVDSTIDRRLSAGIPVDRAGRGIASSKHHILTALPRVDGDASSATLAAGVRGMVTAVRDAWPEPPAPRLRLLPSLVTLDEIRARVPDSRELVLGLDERALAPIGLDTTRDPHLLVFGDSQSGKSSLLRSYLTEVTRVYTPETAQLFVVDYRRSHLGELPDEWVAEYATNGDAAGDLARGLADVLRDRLPGPDVTAEQLRNRSWWQGKEGFVVVDDYELVATSLGNPLEPLVPLLARAVDVGLHVVVARRSGGAGRMFDALITALRDMGQPGVLLSGSPSEGPLVGQLRATPAPAGRGRLLTRDRFDVIQVGWTPSRFGT